ncbi:hypothetical protein SBD_1287 [Streptomyces bottropensis ATCC 25435]|uniref:Uncharacterized protein n=1 Tax=Streptomyces bottropensis ATCC 25435 TaxID=1054862 RepID=M3EL27_9ACTN|nr:hypothetical protein SBD_1287 [Streptomyces bottropensis ATCC 25435]
MGDCAGPQLGHRARSFRDCDQRVLTASSVRPLRQGLDSLSEMRDDCLGSRPRARGGGVRRSARR